MALDLDALNSAQREAVLCTEGPLLVLAGAGSGKTRVLTYRIAYLIQEKGVYPWNILAITFTNKAAREMRERLGNLVGDQVSGMWVSTFHSMCVRMLRAHAERLGFSTDFTIYDDNDSTRLVKEIYKDLNLDPARYPSKAVRARISKAKNELIVPGNYVVKEHDPIDEATKRVYEMLQERLRKANAFDFDDLLLYANLLLKNNSDVCHAYQDRFRYILVDEYQDTNHAQYNLCSMLASRFQNLMVVGDDDQSIYSWRGADIRNILEFEHDYPSCHTVRLEENYRSNGNILSAANAVIAHNTNRKEKTLFTNGPDGDPLMIYAAQDERDEGRWIAGRIELFHNAGISYSDIAVFYRTNAQSRMLEDMFLRSGVPYRIVGGTRFFERKEIVDVMSYLSLCVNAADDIAAKRVINTPRRGIGQTTIDKIEALAARHDISFVEAVSIAPVELSLRAKTAQALGEFLNVLQVAQGESPNLRAKIQAIIDATGIISAYQQEGTDEALSRIDNIKELLGVCDEFMETHASDEVFFEAPGLDLPVYASDDDAHSTRQASSDAAPAQTPAPAPTTAPASAYVPDVEGVTHDAALNADMAALPSDEPEIHLLRGDSLADFVEWVRLRTDLDSTTDGTAAVTLMTIHASKGLEFKCVFVSGMEDSIFPTQRALFDHESLEEERRLAYVAITRAREKLILTHAQQRTLFGETHCNPTSQFIDEIPDALCTMAGIGSAGFSGSGWEKRGSRHGIAGSGCEAGAGGVFRVSSAHGAAERIREKATRTMNLQPGTAQSKHFEPGDLVSHKIFGEGKVTRVVGDSMYVRFTSGQLKKLLVDFAPVVKIS